MNKIVHLNRQVAHSLTKRSKVFSTVPQPPPRSPFPASASMAELTDTGAGKDIHLTSYERIFRYQRRDCCQKSLKSERRARGGEEEEEKEERRGACQIVHLPALKLRRRRAAAKTLSSPVARFATST